MEKTRRLDTSSKYGELEVLKSYKNRIALFKVPEYDCYIVATGVTQDCNDKTKVCWSQGYYFEANLCTAVEFYMEYVSDIS